LYSASLCFIIITWHVVDRAQPSTRVDTILTGLTHTAMLKWGQDSVVRSQVESYRAILNLWGIASLLGDCWLLRRHAYDPV